jgi:diguanylate cyclase (GGDEF)-like protein/PAS domain S-box-containing protein
MANPMDAVQSAVPAGGVRGDAKRPRSVPHRWALPGQPLERARWMLAIFCTASTIALAVVIVASTHRSRLVEVAAALTASGLVLKWGLERAGHRGRVLLDAPEIILLAAAGLELGGLALLLLLYARVCSRALDVGPRHLAAFTTACLGVFIVAMLAQTHSSITLIETAALASGFALAAPVMYLLRSTLERLTAAQERERDQAALRERERIFRELFDSNPLPLWVCDRTTLRFVAANEAAAHLYGYTTRDMLDLGLVDLLPPADRPPDLTSSASRAAVLGAASHQRKDGSRIEVEMTSTGVKLADRDALLILANDVTERRALDAQLHHQALHDPLTSLANRTLLTQRTEAVIEDARPAAMMVMDLAGFKAVNDTFGHAEGDGVLAAVAQRLRETVRPGDTAARLGGDEFAVLVTDVADADEAASIARRIEQALAPAFYVGSRLVPIACSLGIALIPDDRLTVDEILRNADAAMYAAKRTGRHTHVIYESGMVPALSEHLQVLEDLERALQSDQLYLVYQPQVSLKTGRVTCVEALVRWRHPVRGDIAPDVFIPIAEQGGRISPLTEWVLRTACAQAESWRSTGWGDVRVAVNISAHDLDGSALIDYVTAALAVTAVEPWQLELELTETAVVRQANALERLHALRAVGLSIAIDDFGTGYSMLSRLRSVPADSVKIDRSFVHDVETDDVAATIVRATTEMGRKLGLSVVAEGVQSLEAVKRLRSFGCHAVQGYFISRPLAPDALRRWVESSSAEQRRARILGETPSVLTTRRRSTPRHLAVS